MKRRNTMIEIWRLVFSALIVCGHAVMLPWAKKELLLFKSASIGVEFFFILSGYLMAESAEHKIQGGIRCRIGEDSRKYVFHKMKGIYPAYLFAFCMSVFVELFLPYPGNRLQPSPLYYIWDFLLLRVSGLQGDYVGLVVGASWYLSAMLLAIWILYPLILRDQDVFFNVGAPLLSIFILGWFSATYGNIKLQLDFQHGICLGLLRGIAELCVGCMCFTAAQWLRTIKLCGWRRILFTAAEVSSFLGVVWIALQYYRSQADFICIALLAVGITVSFSGCSFTNELSRKLQLPWAGKFSLALYLNHTIWIRLLNRWKIPAPFYWHVTVLFILSVTTAIVCMCTIDLIGGLRLKARAHD